MAEKRTITIDLGLTRDDYGQTRTAELVLETGKAYHGGVESEATVFWVAPGSRQHAFGLGATGGDFSVKVSHTDRNVKATQNAIDRQHNAVFTEEVIQRLTESAKAHYAARSKTRPETTGHPQTRRDI